MIIKTKNGTNVAEIPSREIIQGRPLISNLSLERYALGPVNLSNMFFQGGNFDDGNFNRSNIRDSIFEGTSMCGASFENADLRNAEFYLVFALHSTFSNANLRHLQFFGGNYANANFSFSDLRGAAFQADNMCGAINLKGANFEHAILDNTQFSNVQFDEYTKFPPKYDITQFLSGASDE